IGSAGGGGRDRCAWALVTNRSAGAGRGAAGDRVPDLFAGRVARRAGGGRSAVCVRGRAPGRALRLAAAPASAARGAWRGPDRGDWPGVADGRVERARRT